MKAFAYNNKEFKTTHITFISRSIVFDGQDFVLPTAVIVDIFKCLCARVGSGPS